MWAFKITLQLSLIHKQQTNLQIKSPCAAIPSWVSRQFGCKKKLPARGANQFAGFGKFHLLANLEEIKYKILRNLDNKNELKVKFSCLDTFDKISRNFSHTYLVEVE